MGDRVMRRWYVPLTVLGIGGLGVALVGTRRGRDVVRRTADFFENVPDHLEAWNNAMDQEVNTIQQAVDAVADMLGAPRTAN